MAKSIRSIKFNITDKCNCFCKMCDIGIWNRKHLRSEDIDWDTETNFKQNLLGPESKSGDLLTSEEWNHLIDILPPKIPISMHSTEPLLYKDLFKIINYAARKGNPIHITTNGVLLGKHINDFVESRKNGANINLCVSIDGTPEIHDEIRGIPGSCSKIIKSMEELRSKTNIYLRT